jgi:hypothetical protein
MQPPFAETIGFEVQDLMELDRLPGVPLLGFLSGTVISLGLWALISWVALHLVA